MFPNGPDATYQGARFEVKAGWLRKNEDALNGCGITMLMAMLGFCAIGAVGGEAVASLFDEIVG